MNIYPFLVGIVVFLGIKEVITPPAVSIPSDNGVTSKSSKSCTCLLPSPDNMAAYTAAPYATASSGLIDLLRVLPLKKSCSIC